MREEYTGLLFFILVLELETNFEAVPHHVVTRAYLHGEAQGAWGPGPSPGAPLQRAPHQ